MPLFQSTHPVWGGTIGAKIGIPGLVFQSTHPVWGGTLYSEADVLRYIISIHPPRVGWDDIDANLRTLVEHFNPPTPCGVGLPLFGFIAFKIKFQSTHPVWGGT